MSQQFYKLQGTGNDFVFFFASELKTSITSEYVRQACSRQTGIGADGLAVLRADGTNWEWDFYNADGGEAEMCGNAARCASHLIFSKTGASKASVKTKVGHFLGSRTDDGEIEVVFTPPQGTTQELKSLFGGRFPVGYLTNTGVPHCVIPVEKPWELRSRAQELAPHIFDKAFGAAGSNLTFVNWNTNHAFETITLERGVNDFTLSCGTGVIAAAKIYADLKNQGGWRKLITPGGILSVHYQPGEAQVRLKGPAQIVFKGEI